jgi:hypothetical protein
MGMKGRTQPWRTTALFFAVAFAGAAGCEPAQAPQVATVSLRVRGAPADATVVLDDATLGTFDFVAAHGVALPPGLHRVSVHASGYFPWDRAVEAKEGSGPIVLQVAMTPVPD